MERRRRPLLLPMLAAGLVLAAIAVVEGTAVSDPAIPPPDPALWGRPTTIPFPSDNPYNPEKAALGEKLFFDVRLSGGNRHSCASCHSPDAVWSDGRPRAVGEPGLPLARRTPSIQDMAWGRLYFWDGRAGTLEEQVLGPVTAPGEMNQDPDTLLAELAADPAYDPLFRAAFPEAAGPGGPITLSRIQMAIATFERTLRSAEAPFDRWVAGDATAVGAAAKRGFALFTGRAGCANCHMGWAFTDHAFHDIGLPGDDPGRGALLADLGQAFKTPSLRDSARRAHYMHDGSLDSLETVLGHYVSGVVDRPGLSDDLPRLDRMSGRDKADLVAFLLTLTGDGATGNGATGAEGPGRPVAATGGVVPASVAPPVADMPHGAPTSVTISQKDRQFQPGSVTIATGGVLVIENDDHRRHNVRVSDPGLDVNSGIQQPGDTVRIPMSVSGSYTAYCGIHPDMRLHIRAVDPEPSRP